MGVRGSQEGPPPRLATSASVVSMRAAIEAAFCRAVRATFGFHQVFVGFGGALKPKFTSLEARTFSMMIAPS